jgi:outer membrane lipoprotein
MKARAHSPIPETSQAKTDLLQGSVMKRGVWLVAAAAALLLHGCTYAVSSKIARQADRSIAFADIEADPGAYQGALVILGGIVVAISNTEPTAVIEVLQKPLDYWGKPISTSRSGGRFIVLHHGYLDPMVYRPGQAITVAALIKGDPQAGLSNTDQRLPAVLSQELKRWPSQGQSRDRPRYLDPLYDPRTSPRDY